MVGLDDLRGLPNDSMTLNKMTSVTRPGPDFLFKGVALTTCHRLTHTQRFQKGIKGDTILPVLQNFTEEKEAQGGATRG